MVYKKIQKIKYVLNSTISQVYNKTWQHAVENIAMSEINQGLGQKCHKSAEKSPYSEFMYI